MWLLVGVDQRVTPQVGVLVEARPADGAAVGLGPRVHHLMVAQVHLGAEGFAADLAFKVLDSKVAAGVGLQAGLGAEGLVASLTRPWSLVGVDLTVLL